MASSQYESAPNSSRNSTKRPKTDAEIGQEYDAAVHSGLLVPLDVHQVPIVFHPEYDVRFFGIEKWHPFDACKWGKVFQRLKDYKLLSDESIVKPKEATRRDLRIVHPASYLNMLFVPCYAAKIFELPIVAFIPYCLLNHYLLRRMRFHVGGTVAACRLALLKNWAINIGGGFHHASADRGGGFCVYADITLAIKILLLLNLVRRVIIVDLDAHQGNGHERDFLEDPRVFILDVYNPSIYPRDELAKNAISRSVEVKADAGDFTYLDDLETELETVLGEFAADLIVYNAGTDSLGIRARDEIVFRAAKEHSIPIAMVTSGGYQPDNWEVIADSIKNLHDKKLIHLHP
ncbi:unnamed protein product, partial [Mesorhabditis spiculigera]